MPTLTIPAIRTWLEHIATTYPSREFFPANSSCCLVGQYLNDTEKQYISWWVGRNEYGHGQEEYYLPAEIRSLVAAFDSMINLYGVSATQALAWFNKRYPQGTDE